MHDQTTRYQMGRALDFLGQVSLPLGIGAFFGFWAADRGVPLLPDMLGLLLLNGLLGIGLIVLGRILMGKAFKTAPEGQVLRRRVLVLLVLGLLAVAGRIGVWWTEQPSALTSLTPEEFEIAFEIDLRRYQSANRELEGLVGRLEESGVPRPGDQSALTAEEERLLLGTWQSIFDNTIELDRLRAYWEDWYRYDPSRLERSYHLRSFLLTFAAELALYEKAARFSERILANDNAKKYLDIPHPELGLPEGTFSRFRQELLGTRDQARLIAGEEYLSALELAFAARTEARQLGVDELWDAVVNHIATIEAVAPIDRAALTMRADTQILKRGVRRVWFPVQKETAEWMGDTRVRRLGWYLITPEQVAVMDPSLQPGDVLLSRKNWYLSNIGLPGFWPHAALYMGDPDKFAAYFDDPDVRAYVERLAGRPMGLPEYLATQHPTEWRRFVRGEEEHPFRVMEALSEGVVLSSLEHAAGDYLAALRPRLDKVAKAHAMVEAWKHLGKPYDFDFDFATDHTIVCSELVWRIYRPIDDIEGLDLPLVEVAGRMTLPANELARYYANNVNNPDRKLDFVYFLDAIEEERKAVIADEAVFRTTADRVKWDVLQQ